ncbi:mannitol dehydrogenase family protein [Polaromonas sp. P2-4]|nr:mannitol dehydrogenase family protein [Polaromonas sp. P2-4]
MLKTPILQFGTSRFLQAHVDLFVSEALACGEALGGITVVQTTGNPASAGRVAALASGHGYPVRVRGLRAGIPVDEMCISHSVQAALNAGTQWQEVCSAAREAQIIISNTGDSGYALDPRDGPALIENVDQVPQGFVAKLVVLLFQRWQNEGQALPARPLTLYPCELIARNGDTLRDLVCGVARAWELPESYLAYLSSHCCWANTLVDRIVPEALEPVGAIAEPYALWVIERQAGLQLPCTHSCIVLTDDLTPFAQRKLFMLNLGHSYLAERWLVDARSADETVFQAMSDAALRVDLEAVWITEVLPVFEALGQKEEALDYLVKLRDRLLNPFVAHRMADIAQNHAAKKQRRLAPLIALARQLGLTLEQPRLRAAVQRDPGP